MNLFQIILNKEKFYENSAEVILLRSHILGNVMNLFRKVSVTSFSIKEYFDFSKMATSFYVVNLNGIPKYQDKL